MAWYASSEIIGFEDPTGIYCAECWLKVERGLDDEVTILTASNAAEENSTIVCDKCGKAVWE
jgi:uncharacterized protein with PIN domain